jgi:hypothetical protein
MKPCRVVYRPEISSGYYYTPKLLPVAETCVPIHVIFYQIAGIFCKSLCNMKP